MFFNEGYCEYPEIVHLGPDINPAVLDPVWPVGLIQLGIYAPRGMWLKLLFQLIGQSSLLSLHEVRLNESTTHSTRTRLCYYMCRK